MKIVTDNAGAMKKKISYVRLTKSGNRLTIHNAMVFSNIINKIKTHINHTLGKYKLCDPF